MSHSSLSSLSRDSIFSRELLLVAYSILPAILAKRLNRIVRDAPLIEWAVLLIFVASISF